MSTSLDLGPCIGGEADVQLKPMRISARSKTFEGMLLTIQTNRSDEKKMTGLAFVIYDATSSDLACHGDVGFGTTPNKMQLYAIL